MLLAILFMYIIPPSIFQVLHKCSIYGCKRTPTLFTIPEAVKKDGNLLLKWNQALGIDCSVKGVKICKTHFESKHILQLVTGRHRLHPNAFPLPLPDPCMLRVPRTRGKTVPKAKEISEEQTESLEDHSERQDADVISKEYVADTTEKAMETKQFTLNERLEDEGEEICSHSLHVTGDHDVAESLHPPADYLNQPEDPHNVPESLHLSDDYFNEPEDLHTPEEYLNEPEDHPHLPGDNHSLQSRPSTISCYANDEFLDNTELNESCVKVDSDNSAKIVCGLPSLDHLAFLCEKYESLMPSAIDSRPRIIITLMMLKQNISYDFLGILFKINTNKISYVVKETLPVLSQILSPAIFWPEKERLRVPLWFRKFRNVRAIVESVEAIVEKPTCINCQKSLFSERKSYHTVKFLVAVSPCGTTTFCSDSFGGATENHNIIDSSGFVQKLEEGDAVMADEGLLLELIGKYFLSSDNNIF